MLEIPEAVTLAKQLNQKVRGNRITDVVADTSPHKFAWFHGDPQSYPTMLVGKTVGTALAQGGLVEINLGETVLLLGDGVRLRYHNPDDKRPKKHQLLLVFEDRSALSASVQMYGGLWAFEKGEFDNPYYHVAKEKPSPLSEAFNKTYFEEMITDSTLQKRSVKALLATEQRIPGLGNGVLQDILYEAKIHPRRKIASLSPTERAQLFTSLKNTLSTMAEQGGRDTERDLFNQPGGYVTKMSKNTVGERCPLCATVIEKAAYMGGSVYWCGGCQPL